MKGIRLAIHAGPVFKLVDPILELNGYMGRNVSLAARLEPVTTSGRIFITEAFAAYLTAKSPNKFDLKYVGNIMYAKKYGFLPTYWLKGVKSCVQDAV